MSLLRLITWPYARKHVLRMLLTTGGIVLGVAVFIATTSANDSVLSAFSQTVDRIAGKTELQVSAGESGFPEEILERVQAAASVAVAVPVIEAVVSTNVRGEGSLLVLGVDMTGDRRLRDYDLEDAEDAVVDDPLVFLAQPDSIILAAGFVSGQNLGIGSRIALGTVAGSREFTVRGIMRAGGLASAFGGNLAIMDIYAAQKMFGRDRTFDRIDLALKPGASLAESTHELQAILGPGFQIEPPSSRGQHFETMIASFAVMMRASSLFALFIGMFIIYNAFGVAVTERRSEIGILRALGATRAQIRWLFLGESAVLGITGSVLGMAVGLLVARGVTVSVSAVLNEAFGVARDTAEVSLTPTLLALAVGLGISTSLVAAWIPARGAARVDPVKALQKGAYQSLSTRESRTRLIVAVVCLLASVVCLLGGTSRPVFYASYALAIAAVLLLGNVLTVGLARLLRPAMRWWRPVEGALAADSLIQTARRTSATVAAVMLSVALIIAFAGMARASYGTIVGWVDTSLNPDLFVLPSHQISIRTLRFPAAMRQELEAMPGIRGVQAVRNPRIMFRNTPVMLLALDLAAIEALTPVRTVDGVPDMLTVAAAGKGVLVSDNLAQLQGLRSGELLELAAPTGTIRLPIVGILVDYSDQQGAVIIDRSLFQQYWGDDSVNFYRLYLTDGVSVADVKRRILERYAGERQVFVLNNDELRRYILRIADQWFALTYIQVGIAVLVAILGIATALTVSITDRRRELATLRAVGGLNGQIRRTIWMEALGTGTLGVVLGSLFGAINLYYVLEIVRHDVAGMRLDYAFPFGAALAVAPVILAAAFVAAIWPAELAVRSSLMDALAYE